MGALGTFFFSGEANTRIEIYKFISGKGKVSKQKAKAGTQS
jgi:hypothetical protein